MMGHRPRTRGGDVFLAREDQLHWFLRDVGENRRLDRCVRPDAPAVAATEKLLMHPDLIRRRLQNAGDDLGGQRAELRAGPDIGRLAVLRNLGDSVHRLHLCVIGVF